MKGSDYFKKKEITPESGIRFLLSHDIKIYPVGGVVVVNRSGVQIFGSKEYRNNKELNKGIRDYIADTQGRTNQRDTPAVRPTERALLQAGTEHGVQALRVASHHMGHHPKPMALKPL